MARTVLWHGETHGILGGIAAPWGPQPEAAESLGARPVLTPRTNGGDIPPLSGETGKAKSPAGI